MNIDELFPSVFLKAADLQGREHVVTIERVEYVPLGELKEMKPVMTFVGRTKKWAFGKTVGRMLAEILGTREIDRWIGRPITIFPTKTEFKGQIVDCIRPKAAPDASRVPVVPAVSPPAAVAAPVAAEIEDLPF